MRIVYIVTTAPKNLPPSSATKLSPSSSSSAADIAAVTVTATDLRGVSRHDGSSDQNISEPFSHFRVIVCLKAKRFRPGDGTYGDDVALQNIARLDDGHCITLIQQLFTGKRDMSSATVTADPDIPGAFTSPSRSWKMIRAVVDLYVLADSMDSCSR